VALAENAALSPCLWLASRLARVAETLPAQWVNEQDDGFLQFAETRIGEAWKIEIRSLQRDRSSMRTPTSS
jgi:hypothetical protein